MVLVVALLLSLLPSLPAAAATAAPRVSIATSTQTPVVGKPFVTSGKIRGLRSAAGRFVQVQLRDGSRWTTVKRTRATRTGTYRAKVVLREAGRASVRVRVPRKGQPITSRVRSLKVYQWLPVTKAWVDTADMNGDEIADIAYSSGDQERYLRTAGSYTASRAFYGGGYDEWVFLPRGECTKLRFRPGIVEELVGDPFASATLAISSHDRQVAWSTTRAWVSVERGTPPAVTVPIDDVCRTQFPAFGIEGWGDVFFIGDPSALCMPT